MVVEARWLLRSASSSRWLYKTIGLLPLLSLLQPATAANSDANRLYEDLMMSYNRFVRPVQNDSDTLMVKLGLKLSQLIDVVSSPVCLSLSTRHNYLFIRLTPISQQNLRYQMMTTIVWVEQEWSDYKLKWDPDDYGGISKVGSFETKTSCAPPSGSRQTNHFRPPVARTCRGPLAARFGALQQVSRPIEYPK